MHPRPALADLRNDARHLLDRALAARDIRAPLAGQQQVPAAEHIERQVAVLVVIAVEEPAFLLPVERDVGVIQIQHDLTRRTLMRFKEQIDQQRIDLCPVAIDLVVLRRMAPRRVLQTIERALASQRLAVGPQHRAQLARQHRERRVLAQLIVIVEVLVAERQTEDALSDQRVNLMLNIAGIAPIDEAVGEATYQSEATVDLSQQQRTCIRSDTSAVEPGYHRTPLNRFKFEQLRRTFCLHRGVTSDRGETVAAQRFSQIRSPDAPPTL